MNRLAIALGALVLVRTASAADAPDYGPIPSWVKPVEVPAPVAADGAPVKLLLQDQQFNFLPQSQESFLEAVVRIQTSQGLQAMSTLQLPWKPDTDVLTIHKVQIRRGDEVIDALANGQKFTLLRRENNLEYSALDGVLTAAFQPADLRVGDILDIAYSVKRTDPIMAGSAEQVGAGWIQAPYARVHVRARWPRSSVIRWRATDEKFALKEQADGDFTEVTYTADNIEPPVQPTGAPLRFLITRQLEFSGFKSWPEVSKRVAPLYVKAATLAADSPLKAEATRIKSVAHTPMDRANAALSLVEDNVRYVFLGMNEGGIVPADADLTWSRRFGDCKAKTVLLIALLHELGIEAEPVAVNTRIGDGLDARLPMIGLFDHVIVRAHLDGQVYWLDGTRSADRHLTSLKTPNYYWGLPLLPGGSELTRIEAAPLTVPAGDTHIQIDATAGILMPAPFHVDTVLSGDTAIAMKLRLASLTGDALERGLREYWSKTYDFVDIKSVAVKFDDDAETETLSMDGSAHMVWKDQWYETNGLGMGYEAQFTRPDGANLTAPYGVSFPIYVRTSEKIILPKGGPPFTTSGKEYDSVIGGIEYKRKFSLVGETFTAEASVRSIKPEFPANEATEAQTTLRAMARDGLYLRKPDQYVGNDADAVAEALARKPVSAQEFIDRGVILLNHRDYDHALTDFNMALVLNPVSDYARANRALTYLWKNDYAKAATDLDAADALNPANPVALRARGMLAFRLGKYADAITDFTKALQVQPGNFFALNWRAFAYERMNKPVEAIADGTEVLKASPKDTEMYRLRGVAYARTGQVDLAMADARAVIGVNDSLESYRFAGTIYAAAGKLDEAQQAISHVLDVAPSEEMYLLRATLHSPADKSGRDADVESALKLNPRSARALYLKASNEYKDGQYAAAAASATTAMDIDGAKFEYFVLRAMARAKTGELALSKEDVKQARALAKTPPMLNDLCWGLAISNVALSDALSACDAAIAKGPGNPAFLDSRGFVLLRLGRYKESIAAYDAALNLNSNYPTSYYGRGLAKRGAGDADGSAHDIAAAQTTDKRIADLFASYGLPP